MKRYRKKDFPVENIRRFLEPGPIVLVGAAWRDEPNVMTMGWHTAMGFTPSLVKRYNFFICEVLKAHVAIAPKLPRTIHYRGNGEFMISGEETRRYRRLFRPEML